MRVPTEERAAEPAEPSPVAPSKPKKRAKRRAIASSETAIWDGLIKAPAQLETSLGESLLYPLWGGTGVVLLVLFPPLLWLTSVPFVPVLIALWSTDGVPSLPAYFLLLPVFMGFMGVVSYVLLYLGGVAASSALGDLHHPRWPDWDLSSIVFGLWRWAWAGLVGVVVGGIPATAYWLYCGDVDLFDALILAELLALGAVYALMALLASILHEDALAANPITVVVAIWRSGWGYAQPCLLAGGAVVVAATLAGAAVEVENAVVSAVLFWAFWVVALYEAMVVLRVLGLFYHERAGKLGWFRGRTGWGV